MNENLTKRQLSILDFIKTAIKNSGYPPTVREICSSLNIKSPSTVHKEIASLVELGYIKKDPSKPRALIVINKDDASSCDASSSNSFYNNDLINKSYTASASTSDSFSASAPICDSSNISLPVLGSVPAGPLATADGYIESYMNIPQEFTGRGNSFILRVKGESMINAGIFDGDYLVVEESNTANNGDIVVALVDGFETEGTVKRFFKEDGCIRLQPENDSMPPIFVKNCRIAGKVKSVFRRVN